MIKIIAKSRAYRPINYYVAISRTMTVSNCCLNLPLVIESTYSSTQQYSFQVSYNTFAFSLTMSKIGKGGFEPPTHYLSSQLSYFPWDTAWRIWHAALLQFICIAQVCNKGHRLQRLSHIADTTVAFLYKLGFAQLEAPWYTSKLLRYGFAPYMSRALLALEGIEPIETYRQMFLPIVSVTRPFACLPIPPHNNVHFLSARAVQSHF